MIELQDKGSVERMETPEAWSCSIPTEKFEVLRKLADEWKTEVVGCDGKFVQLKEHIQCSSEPIEGILASLNVSERSFL